MLDNLILLLIRFVKLTFALQILKHSKIIFLKKFYVSFHQYNFSTINLSPLFKTLPKKPFSD